MYMAWLCYHQVYDLDEQDITILFEEPEDWKYSKVIPIQFSVLHRWDNKDKALYK